MVEKFDYAEAAADAAELIEEFGQNGFIVRTPPGNGPAHNPGNGAPVPHAAIFAVVDFDARLIDGSTIRAKDKRVLLSTAGLTIEPVPTDKIRIGGVDHSIVGEVKTLKPADIVVMYEIQARR